MASRYSRTAYGISDALVGVAPSPIISNRNPTANDRAILGQQWINKANNSNYVLTSVVGGASTWASGANAAANFATAGFLTCGNVFTVTAGGATITAGGLTVTAGGAAITGLTAVTGAITATTTVTAGTGMTVVLGNIVATAGNIRSTLGDIIATQGNIVATLGDIIATQGNIEATLGDIVIVNGDLELQTAGTSIGLPGPVSILTGAGVPGAPLALNVGDFYINTAAVAINTRVYVATAAGVWTALVTLA
jgi:hypothetical protein